MTNFVFVHGGFVGGSYWSEVAQRLEKAGHRADVIEQLPSAGSDATMLGDLAADVAAVRERVESVGEPVVLVGHSSGGMTITELADHPSIAHSVYLAAAWPTRGQSLLDLYAGEVPPWVVPQNDGTARVTDDLDLLHQTLCADVDRKQAEPDLRAMVPQSMSDAAAPSSAPERKHPTTYIICENDQALPPPAQEQMAAAADHVERLRSSHQPMTSMPDELAAILGRVH